jgi:hypothetical protein
VFTLAPGREDWINPRQEECSLSAGPGPVILKGNIQKIGEAILPFLDTKTGEFFP